MAWTSAPTRARADVSSFQWIGTKDPARDLGGGYVDTKHGAPCAVLTLANPSSVRPSFTASSGLTSTKGSGLWLASFGERPVRVIVCH